MTKRRGRGDGGLHWDAKRDRWIASVTIGYTPDGRRIVRKASGKTKTAARDKLKENLRDRDDGLAVAPGDYTVAQTVRDLLAYGLSGREQRTIEKLTTYANSHIIPALGPRKLRDLSADDVDRWLAVKAKELSTSTLQELRSRLRRAVTRAQARDKVKRNVVLLCEVPRGREGRTSKALTFAQAEAVLSATDSARIWLCAYVVVSPLTGARTEEMRALTWTNVVAYDQDRQVWASVADVGWDHEDFGIYVWRSVRLDGDTKTDKSRRTLKLPVTALRALWDQQLITRTAAEDGWENNDLVFATRTGRKLSAGNVRREFRRVITKAGLVGTDWTPRELRHSFVSLLSDSGMPVEQISRLVGHRGTAVTETVYRLQIRPVMEEGATAMDGIFGTTDPET
ncbi:MAG: hypothetical protein JWN00_5085 [Actinomycetia bacterium]|nr:hypothetical protein [Actinomycetes bacterium]